MSTYTVQPGDTLYAIAQAQFGNGNLYPQIVAANPAITDPNQIFVGEQIEIPDVATGGSVPAAPPITQTALTVVPTTVTGAINTAIYGADGAPAAAPASTDNSSTIITLALLAAGAAGIWYYMNHMHGSSNPEQDGEDEDEFDLNNYERKKRLRELDLEDENDASKVTKEHSGLRRVKRMRDEGFEDLDFEVEDE